MISDILELKKKTGAVILAHNYVDADIQDIADFCGDSLELSRKAKSCDAENIIFCGVKFMGETAKILSPKAHVFMPDPDAGCPMADMCDPDELRAFKAAHPDHVLVAYVNTTALTKSLVDICVTSGNAEKIIKKLGADKPITFLPDRNLGANLNKKLNIHMNLWHGCCPIHNRVSVQDILNAKNKYPDAPVMVHLECQPDVVDIADAALSTAGMLKYVETSSAKSFIVGTEKGMLHRLELSFPDRTFYAVEPNILCVDMKKPTLAQVRDCLLGKGHEIILSDEIIESAARPIIKMLEMA